MDPTINPKMVQLEPGMLKLYLDIEKNIPTNANPCAEVVLEGSTVCTLQDAYKFLGTTRGAGDRLRGRTHELFNQDEMWNESTTISIYPDEEYEEIEDLVG